MEKMQETIKTVNTITKDIEEIKNKKIEMNNTITEIKNMLEVTNSRITEEEEQISEQEDRMMEITSEEQTKGKRMKKIEDSLRDFETILNTSTFELQGSQRKKKKRKALRKFLKKLQLKTSPTWEVKEIVKSKKCREFLTRLTQVETHRDIY